MNTLHTMLTCYVECKNYGNRAEHGDLDQKEMVHKIEQANDAYDNAPFDHFIFISPHGRISNDLSAWLKARRARYPFGIQFGATKPQTNPNGFVTRQSLSLS